MGNFLALVSVAFSGASVCIALMTGGEGSKYQNGKILEASVNRRLENEGSKTRVKYDPDTRRLVEYRIVG